MSTKYWTQVQAPAGNFYDYFGTYNFEIAKSCADHLIKQGKVARVIDRTDTPIYTPGAHKEHDPAACDPTPDEGAQPATPLANVTLANARRVRSERMRGCEDPTTPGAQRERWRGR